MSGGAYHAAEFAVGPAVRGCTKTDSSRGGDGTTVWLCRLPAAAAERSVAAATFPVVGDPVVWQSGSRNLWDEVEAAHAWWASLGKPELDDFGLTVTVANDGTVRRTPGTRTRPDRCPRPERLRGLNGPRPEHGALGRGLRIARHLERSGGGGASRVGFGSASGSGSTRRTCGHR